MAQSGFDNSHTKTKSSHKDGHGQDQTQGRMQIKVYAKRHAKKRTKTVASNTKPPPTAIEKALNMEFEGEAACRWLDSILDEWNGLGNLGVLAIYRPLRNARNWESLRHQCLCP